MLIETASELVKHRHVSDGLNLQKDMRVLSIRKKMMQIAGEKTVQDALQLCKYCETCQSHKLDPTFIVLDQVPEYSDIYEFIAAALKADGGVMLKSSRKCKTCAQLLSLFRDYHRYDPERKKDLVVRAFFQDAEDTVLSFTMLWMDIDGRMEPVSSSEIPNALNVVRREIAASAREALKNDDLQKCAEYTKFLLYQTDTSPELTDIAYKLVNTSKRGLAEAVGLSLIERHPDSPEGYALVSQVLVRGYADGAGMIPELLEEAEQYSRLALEKDPSHAASRLSHCNCLRLRNDDPMMVTAAYRDLIAKHPTYAAAYYNYGLHCLTIEPKQAAVIFAKGAELDPTDSDFLVKQAMALVKVGADAEAQKVMSKARTMAPNNPQLSMVASKALVHH